MFIAAIAATMPFSYILFSNNNVTGNNLIYLHQQHKATRSSEAHLNQFSNIGNVILNFYADWCNPCKRMSPIIEGVAAAMQNFTFIRINRDYYLDLAKLYNITSIPTLIFLKDGKEIGRVVEYGTSGMFDKDLGDIISK